MLPLSETLKANPRANNRPANVTMNAGIRNLPINVPCTSPMAPHVTIGTTMPASEPHREL